MRAKWMPGMEIPTECYPTRLDPEEQALNWYRRRHAIMSDTIVEFSKRIGVSESTGKQYNLNLGLRDYFDMGPVIESVIEEDVDVLSMTQDEFKKYHFRRVLEDSDSGRDAARRLRLSHTEVRRRIASLGIQKEETEE
jgi:hypothetical protein